MGKNYFSKYGGPYFINNGFSKHHNHDENNSEDNGSERSLILSVCIGTAIMLITLYALVLSF
jgi:hypothetical protein